MFFSLLIALIFFHSLLTVLVLSNEKGVQTSLYDKWVNNYENNKREIEMIEKSHRCCGFATIQDHPVPDDCSENTEFGFQRSCMDAIKPGVTDEIRLIGVTQLWAVVAETLILVLAVGVYLRSYRETEIGEARGLLRQDV